jgi:hypothetical protein
MTITITATGEIVRTKKPRKATTRKVRHASEKRVFPKCHANMTTRAYVEAYHQANAAVHLTTVEYVGG